EPSTGTCRITRQPESSSVAGTTAAPPAFAITMLSGTSNWCSWVCPIAHVVVTSVTLPAALKPVGAFVGGADGSMRTTSQSGPKSVVGAVYAPAGIVTVTEPSVAVSVVPA